jgi:hypothetical protein
MAALIQSLGATPVTMQFSEVYPALQRGVADCGVTSPTSGNAGKWPEVTSHFLPLSVSGSVQGHFMNLDYWKKLSPEAQAKATAAFANMEDQMWQLADKANADAMNCNVGAEPCKEGTKFKMTMVQVSPGRRGQGQGCGVDGGAAAVEGELQQGRPEVQRELERHGRQGARVQDQLDPRDA